MNQFAIEAKTLKFCCVMIWSSLFGSLFFPCVSRVELRFAIGLKEDDVVYFISIRSPTLPPILQMGGNIYLLNLQYQLYAKPLS